LSENCLDAVNKGKVIIGMLEKKSTVEVIVGFLEENNVDS
jgi:hypothetical protein